MDFIKNALKTMLKAIFSACIVNLILLFLVIYIVGSSFSNLQDEGKPKLKKGSTLFINTSMYLSDIALGDRIDVVVSGYAKMSLLELYERIISAAEDPNIKEIFMHNSKADYAFNLSQSVAIKKALATFKESGKKVYYYLANPSVPQSEYFLATVSDEIWINPQSIIDFKGISFEGVFFGAAFEKYGLEANIVKCGANKSFGDMFTKTAFSPETKADLEDIAKNIGQYLSASFVKDRSISMENCALIRGKTPLLNAEKAVSLGFVDKSLYMDEAEVLLGVNKAGFNAIDVTSYTPKYRVNKIKSKSNIAIVYMTGAIVEFGNQDKEIASYKFCKTLSSIEKDPSIKAVILVLNSSGGSAYASEQIRRSVETLSEKKKTIAYVTSTCASGAYWIATACHKIYAQETSLIGSIGVFSILFDIQKLSSNFGVTFDNAKSGEFADLFSSTRKPTEVDLAIMQTQVDEIYNQFISLVASSRKLDTDFVKENIATGSIWTSQKAKSLGLIDSADNNLPDTLRQLAKDLDLDPKDYGILTFPKPKSYGELFQELFTGESSVSAEILMPKIIRDNSLQELLPRLDDKNNLYLRNPLLLKDL